MIGEKTAEVEKFWQTCRAEHGIDTETYHASTFADPRLAPYHDSLLELVAQGRKRATAHLALDFERNGIATRSVGDYWVILSGTNDPRFLIRVTDVETKPFNEVNAAFAAREGEGDSSLAYWTEVHRDYFERQCAEWGVAWRDDLPTVCEGFDLIASV